MKKKLTTIFLIVTFIVGFLVLMYPSISNYYNEKVGSYAISSYEKSVSDTSQQDIDSILEKAEEYNKELAENQIPFKNGKSEDKNYMSQLKLFEEESIMGYITIEKINLKLPIYHTTDEPILQIAVGHLEGSSLPIGGEGTHSVLTGHRGLPSAKLFTDLDKLEKGDLIEIKVLNKTITYKVRDTSIIEPQQVDSLKIEEGKDLLTLITCTPYGVNSHRLLIHGERTDNVISDEVFVTNDAMVIDSIFIAPLIAAPILVILFIASTVSKKKRKNK